MKVCPSGHCLATAVRSLDKECDSVASDVRDMQVGLRSLSQSLLYSHKVFDAYLMAHGNPVPVDMPLD